VGSVGKVAGQAPRRQGSLSGPAALHESSRVGGPTAATSRVDLHCHTTASDGGLSPQELVALAASLGIEVLAITDHDTIEGVPAAQTEAQRQGLDTWYQVWRSAP